MNLAPHLPPDYPNSPAICLLSDVGEPEPPLATPEGKESNLTIAKTVAASEVTASGQSTKFTITVTNEGPGVFNAPIEIRDTLFDGAIVEPSNGSWSAPWVCEGQSAVGHPEQGICAHPPIELDPGESVVLELEIEAPNSFIAPSGTQVKCGYENKAEVLRPAPGSPKNADAGDDVAFADVKFAPFEMHGKKFCDLGLTTPERPKTNLTIAKTVGACATTPAGQNCPFAITVTNAGPNAYSGAIEIRDTLFDGAIVEPSNGSWSAPWTCEGQSAAGHPEQGICTHPPVELDPGESVVLDLEIEAPDSFVAPSGSQVKCGYENKAEIIDPAGGSAGNTNAGDDIAVAEAKFPPFEKHGRTFCAPPTNLTIAKTVDACTSTTGGQNCGFTITVSNNGPNAYGGPIEIRDTLFDGQIVEPSNGSWSAPWTCEGQSAAGHPEQGICTHPPVKLDPGESVELKLEAEAPNSFVAPSGSQARCGYKNKVEILDPAGGSNENTNAGDDTAFAEAKFAPYKIHRTTFCAPPANLTIAKTAGDCATTTGGQNCPFTITVTNKGPNAYNGPIEIRDTLFDGQIVEPSNGSWSAPWTCEGQSAAGHPEQGLCTHPPVKLDPGESVELKLEAEAPNSFVAPSGSQARCGYKNKVEILDPAGGGSTNTKAGDDAAAAEAKFQPYKMHGTTFCAPPTNLTIAKTAGDCATTTGGQNCPFTITVTNKGPNAYNGPIEIRDTLFDGQIVEPSNGSWSAPWTCEGQSAAGHPEQGICTHPPVKLDPGESVELKLEAEAPNSFVAPSGSQARCGYKNKVEILDPAGGGSTNTKAGDDAAAAEAKFQPYKMHGTTFCAPPTNLTIAKTAGDCATTTGGQNCPFTITVTNKGPNAYNGPIEIRDTLFDGQIVEPSNGSWSAPWTCEGQSAAGHPEQGLCTHPPVKLDPGESVELKLEAEAPNSFVAPSGSQARCGYKNKVEILDPAGGGSTNTKAGDDAAAAEAKFQPYEMHGTTFCGPPTNLAIAKAAGACATTAGGQNCSFTITVTNKGPNVYKGPIEIRDTLFDGQIVEPSNGSWSAPWTCEGQSAAGHPEQGLCTHPPVKLDPGESVELKLEAEAPNSFVAPSGSQAKCGYTNKAEVLDPAGGSNENTNAGDDAASVKAKFAPFEMHGTTFCGLGLTTPPASACPQGWSRTPIAGKCCPPRSNWDGERCRKIDAAEECKGGMELIDGECRCQRGTRFLDGRCRTPSSGPELTCGVNEIGTYPNCRCARGFTGDPPNCRPSVCPPGTRGKYPDCRKIECPANQQWIGGTCRCPDQLKWNGKRCVADTPKACPADSLGKYPNCRCKRGTTGTPGECKKVEPKRCPADSFGKYPNCRCKRGTTGEPGNCKRIVIEPKKCPKGFRGTPPNCRRIVIEPRRKCLPGFRGTPPNCRRAGTNPP